MKYATAAIALSLLAIVLAGTASAVEVSLECSACTLAPNPVVLTVGQSLEFTCDANCGAACRFVSGVGGVTGVAPFDVTVLGGSSSALLGPATVPDEGVSYQAIQLPGDQDCSFGIFGGVQTASPVIPGLTHWGLVGLASLLVAVSVWALHRHRVAA